MAEELQVWKPLHPEGDTPKPETLNPKPENRNPKPWPSRFDPRQLKRAAVFGDREACRHWAVDNLAPGLV